MTNLNRRQILTGMVAGTAGAIVASAVAADGHAQSHAVAIEGFAFAPGDLTISVGDKVVFTNEDRAPHTATADNGSFDTGTLQKGQAATITFNAAGTYSYFCAVHPHMKATITVTG